MAIIGIDLGTSNSAAAQRQVPTLGGPIEVQVPVDSQPDSVLRLRGKGLPHFGGSGHGDLLLRLQLVVPEGLSAKERALYRQLLDLQAPGQMDEHRAPRGA